MKKFSLLLMSVLVGLWLIGRSDKPLEKKLEVKEPSPYQLSLDDEPDQNKDMEPRKIKKKIDNIKVVQEPIAQDQHRVSPEGELVISQILVTGDYALAHGDILIATYDEVLEMEQKGELPTLPSPKRWEDGIVPYMIGRDYPSPERIQRVLSYINDNSPVQFIERSRSDKNYVKFQLGEEHCFSSLGQQGGEQKIVLNLNCREKEIAHEVMHALGFLHEQNRNDRDQFIKIHWDNIRQDYTEQFKKIPETIFPVEQAKFDFKSTMLYPPFAFALSPSLPTITTNEGEFYQSGRSWLSEGDLNKIKVFYSVD